VSGGVCHSVPLRMCEVTLITITPIVEVVFEGVWNPREMCAMFARTTDTFSPSPRIFCVTPSTFHSSRIRTMSSHRGRSSVFRHHARSGQKYHVQFIPFSIPLLPARTQAQPYPISGPWLSSLKWRPYLVVAQRQTCSRHITEKPFVLTDTEGSLKFIHVQGES